MRPPLPRAALRNDIGYKRSPLPCSRSLAMNLKCGRIKLSVMMFLEFAISAVLGGPWRQRNSASFMEFDP